MSSRHNRITETISMNETRPDSEDATPLDYRIAIADACECPEFRQAVLNSNSNTNGAIYFRKEHLVAIGEHLDIRAPNSLTNSTLRYRIRQEIAEAKSIASAVSGSIEPIPKGHPSVATDGEVVSNSNVDLSTGRFDTSELVELAEVVGAQLEIPYLEPDLRRLAGSPIAGPYLTDLINQAYVDLYLSINVGSTTSERGSRAYYPFRLEPVHEIPKSATSHPECHKYIVDSSINKPEYDNTDALDTAARVGSDAVILADEYHDLDGTVDAIIDGLDLYDDHDYSGEIIIPLQPSHGECYQRLIDQGVSSDHTFALGGLKDCNNDTRKIAAAQSVREVAGDEITLHGLGYGVTTEIADAIREQPSLLDSVDYSTPAQKSIVDTAPGDERLCTVAARAGAELIEDLRNVSPLVDSPKSARLRDF